MGSGFKKIDDNFAVVIGKIDTLENRVDEVGLILNKMRGNSTASLETVENTLTGLTEEISKMNSVTNYEDHFANLKIVSGKDSTAGTK